MSKTTTTDERGRIVIPAAFRERHGDRYRIVELRDRIELIPLGDDPVAGLQDTVGDALEGHSLAEIREAAREDATRQALEDLPEEDS